MTPSNPLIPSTRLLPYVDLANADVSLGFPRPTSIKAQWTYLVPRYESRNYGPTIFTVAWDPSVALSIGKISERRSLNRIDNYAIPLEMERVRSKLSSKDSVAIRFGNRKPGHGYGRERGDFCVIAGVVSKKHLTLYYRSLELIGGFAYDLVLINYLEKFFKCNWRTVTFVTQKAFVFALKGNSNERLYPRLRSILKDK